MDRRVCANIVFRLICIACILLGLSFAAYSDMSHVFNSYHAFLVYGEGEDSDQTDLFASDVYDIATKFGGPWSVNIYGSNLGTSIMNAVSDMIDVSESSTDELFFFYYAGHGDHYWTGDGQGGRGDTDGDEIDSEDPLPPGVTEDVWDEGFAYGISGGDTLWDDEFGDAVRIIQENGCWVSGLLDMCGANGILDGGSDVTSYLGQESVWMTSEVEWEVSSETSELIPALMNSSGGPGTTLGDLYSWYTDASSTNQHVKSDTWGIKVYEEDGSSYKYYIPEVPEPSCLLVLASAICTLALRRRYI